MKYILQENIFKKITIKTISENNFIKKNYNSNLL